MFTKTNLKAAITVAVLSASMLSSSNGMAQISPETATAITSPIVSGSWSTNRAQELYYSFTSAPGQLQVSLDTTSNSPGCQTVRVTILDRDKRTSRNDRQVYGSLFQLACTRRATPKTQNIRIPERRPLLMRVDIESSHSNRSFSGNYQITLGGTFAGKTQLQQIDPNLLRQERLLDRYPLPQPSIIRQ